MTAAPEWTYQHAGQLRNHWWWRPGWHVGTRFYAWHITFDGDAGLYDLVERYQAELSTVPGLDMIPAQWLHLTMQGVGHVEDVSTEQIAAMLDAARRRLADVPPPLVGFHRPVIRPEAIALPPMPVAPIQDIRRAVRAAIGDTFGAGAVPERATGYQPHVSVAYVSAEQPAQAALEALQQAAADPIEVRIDAVSLIEMHRDNRMYEWRTIETVPLGAGRTNDHSASIRSMVEFGETLRKAIDDNGLSVRAAAHALNYDHAFLSRVLAGKQRPSASLIKALDELLAQQGKLARIAAKW